MLYAERDESGKIISLSYECRTEGSEPVSVKDREVIEFLGGSGDENAALELLQASDVELARVTEDLVELLVGKGVILMTELPEAAQMKLLNRRKTRAALDSDAPFIVNEEDIL